MNSSVICIPVSPGYLHVSLNLPWTWLMFFESPLVFLNKHHFKSICSKITARIGEHFHKCVSVLSCRPTKRIKMKHVVTIHNAAQETHSKAATQIHDARWEVLNPRWWRRDCSFPFHAILLFATRWWCWSPFSILRLFFFLFFYDSFEGLQAQRQTLQWIRIWLSPDWDTERCWRGLNK